MVLSPSQRHVLVTAISLLSVIECFGWGGACAVSFLYRAGDPFGPAYSSDQVAHNTAIAVVVTLLLILNLAGTFAFVLRIGSFWLTFPAAVQVVNIVAVIVLLIIQSNGSSAALLVMALPAITLLGLAALWRTSPPHSPNP
jgi:hypothetical protein